MDPTKSITGYTDNSYTNPYTTSGTPFAPYTYSYPYVSPIDGIRSRLIGLQLTKEQANELMDLIMMCVKE